MNEWRNVPIADLCVRTTSGGTPSRKRPDYYCTPPDGVPWLKSQELQDRRIAGAEEHITETGLQRSSAKVLPPDSVLIAMYGATVGQLGYLTVPSSVNQAICALITDPTQTDPRFLYYALMNARSELIAHAHGAAQQNLSQERIRSFALRVPDSVGLQRAIGGVLGTLDDLIENNQHRIRLLEEMARRIYAEWFVHFRFLGCDASAVVNSTRGQTPKDWIVVPLNDLVEVARETVDARELPVDFPAVGLEHIPRRQLTLDNWGQASELQSRKTRFHTGDILFGKIRPYFHKVSVAPLDGICSTDAIVIRPRDPYWGLVALTVSSSEFVAHAAQTATGTKMPRADWKVIGGYQVAIPPEELSGCFTNLVRTCLDTAKTLMFTARNLAIMRDLILPKLVTGQIDVSCLGFNAVVEAAG